MPKPYPQEFREDVIRVARNRGPGVRLKDISLRCLATSHGAPGRIRTCDLGIRSPLLYPLSYGGKGPTVTGA